MIILGITKGATYVASNRKSNTEYLMNRNGFTLLAMVVDWLNPRI